MKNFSLLFILLFLVSCAGDSLLPVKGPEGDPGSELNLAEFEDIPIPLNSKLDKEKSIIISKNRGWLGRLTFDTSENQITVFDFFRNELPKFGWKKLSEVSSDTSLLNYQNQNRLASIQISDNTFYGSNVSITVSEMESN
ncbi:MAG: hypothetical protein CNE97_02635 [alpha proteobacterium MED-G10]|nr:MAG: hypothetical protein CNE97_02635 [alpha proteobacterium MED-G10]|tara:strand:+ start:351 stop:770 length:420 start_codon:yes stop_codon:yes gene_type:complete